MKAVPNDHDDEVKSIKRVAPWLGLRARGSMAVPLALPLGCLAYTASARLAPRSISPPIALRAPALLAVPALAAPPELLSHPDLSLVGAPLLGGAVGQSVSAVALPHAAVAVGLGVGAAALVFFLLHTNVLTLIGRSLLRAAAWLKRARAAALDALLHGPALAYATPTTEVAVATRPAVPPALAAAFLSQQERQAGLASGFRDMSRRAKLRRVEERAARRSALAEAAEDAPVEPAPAADASA